MAALGGGGGGVGVGGGRVSIVGGCDVSNAYNDEAHTQLTHKHTHNYTHSTYPTCASKDDCAAHAELLESRQHMIQVCLLDLGWHKHILLLES